ncbi:hypothetical protein AKJ09_04626 [Labilithrix luteola]|uniref:Uncharacterized protein n=1 Tax=Labilithrix luteola TaxID=1391654 RepID=A0A0K1PWS0_9BACT|nr:hypothetical protein AKJ09_04626 [Labilithrix luteola]
MRAPSSFSSCVCLASYVGPGDIAAVGAATFYTANAFGSWTTLF